MTDLSKNALMPERCPTFFILFKCFIRILIHFKKFSPQFEKFSHVPLELRMEQPENFEIFFQIFFARRGPDCFFPLNFKTFLKCFQSGEDIKKDL